MNFNVVIKSVFTLIGRKDGVHIDPYPSVVKVIFPPRDLEHKWILLLQQVHYKICSDSKSVIEVVAKHYEQVV